MNDGKWDLYKVLNEIEQKARDWLAEHPASSRDEFYSATVSQQNVYPIFPDPLACLRDFLNAGPKESRYLTGLAQNFLYLLVLDTISQREMVNRLYEEHQKRVYQLFHQR